MTIAFLGLGANLGDRRANLESAIEALDWGSVNVTRRSSVYETHPIGGPVDQPMYLNMVIEIDTSLRGGELLERCRALEAALGRERDVEERWGPRTIDIDLLLFGSEVIDSPELVLPHPRMHERAFVLVPLAEIAPHAEIPGRGTVRELLDAVGSRGVRQLA